MKKLLLKGTVLGVVIYALLGFFLLPNVVKLKIPSFFQTYYGVEVSIDSVSFNPFLFSMGLNKFLLKDQENQNLLFFKNFFIDIDPLKSLFTGTLFIKKIALEDSTIDITIQKDRSTNFQFLFDLFASKEETMKQKTIDQGPIRFYIKKFDLSLFRIIFKDNSKREPFEIKTKPIDLSLSDISLDEEHINKIDLYLDTKKSGRVHLVSSFVAEPLRLEGKVEFQDIVLDKFYYYFQGDQLRVDLEAKTFNGSFEYKFQTAHGENSLIISKITAQLPSTLVKIKDTYLLDLENYRLNIDKVSLQQKNGFSRYNIEQIRSRIGQLQIEDKKTHSVLKFLELNTDIPELSSDKNEAVLYKQSLQTNLNGQIDIAGTFYQKPLGIKGEIKIRDLDLTPYKNYLEQVINIDLHSALISSKAAFEYIQKEGDDIIDLAGDLSLQKLELHNSAKEQPLVKIETVDIIKLHYNKDRMDIEKIVVFHPEIEVYFNKDNTTNFDRLAKQKEQRIETTSTQENKTSLRYDIKELFVKNAEMKFEDHTLSPPFQLKQTQGNISVKNISSKQDQYTTLEQESVLAQYALLKIKGKVVADDPFKDLWMDIELQNINLADFTAYGEKYIGNKIDKGKLFLKLNSVIKSGDLKISNKINIQNITLGEKVKSEDAIDVPIELAIAFLKDTKGHIDLDIPIKGNLNDPKFSLGDAFIDLFRNTLIKLVASPFKVLSFLIGEDFEEDISKCYFGYGEADIDPLCREKLDKLSEVLIQRPQIGLSIQPAYVKQEDIRVLKEKKFREKYAFLSDSSKKMSVRLKEISKLFLLFYSKEELVAVSLEEKEKINWMKDKIKEKINILDEELEFLASLRGKNIKKYLLSKKIDNNRIKIEEGINLGNHLKELQKVIVRFELNRFEEESLKR